MNIIHIYMYLFSELFLPKNTKKRPNQQAAYMYTANTGSLGLIQIIVIG